MLELKIGLARGRGRRMVVLRQCLIGLCVDRASFRGILVEGLVEGLNWVLPFSLGIFSWLNERVPILD